MRLHTLISYVLLLCGNWVKSQPAENGFIQCVTALSNFSVWLKLLNHSALELSHKNYG